jgi:thiamine transporter ThiT
MDSTSFECGPIRNIALVLALLKGNKFKSLSVSISMLLINIQFGHLGIAGGLVFGFVFGSNARHFLFD